MQQYKSRLDKIGITAALICMVHCVLVPIVLSLLSLYQPEAIESKWIEISLLATSVMIGGWAIWKGYLHYHRKLSVLLSFALGILLLAAGNVMETTLAEMWLKFSGTTVLIVTHFYNWKRCKSCTVLAGSKELAES